MCAINESSGYETPFTRLCFMVADHVKTERYFDVLKNQHRDVFKEMERYRKHWDRWAVTRARKKAGLADLDWDQSVRVWTGYKILELVITHTDVFEYKKVWIGGRQQAVLVLSEDVRRDLEDQHEDCELLQPFALPMVVPPKDWDPEVLDDGGYLFIPQTFVKQHRGINRLDEYRNAGIYRPVAAVNLLQSTAWRINRRMLEILRTAWQGGGGIGELPPSEPLPLPPRPSNIDTSESAKVQWKRAATKVYDENARLKSKRKAVLHKLWIADRFKDYEAIWFPHNLDWRGRAYPLGSHLHPQSDDPGRALLEFAEGRPLGERGIYWLQVHIANCFGVDKVPFDERIEWVRAIPTTDLERMADDPFEARRWTEADDPWRALAAIIEYVAALRYPGGPEAFPGRQPIAMDGSCNGLQHFSALGRDPVGGKATNLIPSDRPEDIYEAVAEVVRRQVDADCREFPDEHPAHQWKDKITRSVVKQPTMTTPYGVTPQGIRQQFITNGHTRDMEQPWVSAQYLQGVVYDAIGEVVIKAREYMDWLREVARLTAGANHAVRWYAPNGFPVIQEYLEDRSRQITTILQKLSYREPHEIRTVSPHRQERGLPPNFIHSLDAAHMMETVLASHDRGIDSWGMVHDSFAVHAAAVDTLHECIRETFVLMHGDPILDWFKGMVEDSTGVELPDLPPKGELDINVVRDSPYFFH